MAPCALDPLAFFSGACDPFADVPHNVWRTITFAEASDKSGRAQTCVTQHALVICAFRAVWPPGIKTFHS